MHGVQVTQTLSRTFLKSIQVKQSLLCNNPTMMFSLPRLRVWGRTLHVLAVILCLDLSKQLPALLGKNYDIRIPIIKWLPKLLTNTKDAGAKWLSVSVTVPLWVCSGRLFNVTIVSRRAVTVLNNPLHFDSACYVYKRLFQPLTKEFVVRFFHQCKLNHRGSTKVKYSPWQSVADKFCVLGKHPPENRCLWEWGWQVPEGKGCQGGHSFCPGEPKTLAGWLPMAAAATAKTPQEAATQHPLEVGTQGWHPACPPLVTLLAHGFKMLKL